VVLTGWVSGVAYTTTYASRITGKVQILQATSGANTTSYLYGLNQIAEFGLQSVFYLTDGAGSIRHLVDPNGAVKLARMYEPFGQVLVQTGVGDPIYGYLGAQFDRISGLLYINGRYYDPVTGRFLSPSSGGSNPYVPLGGAALAPILILALIGRKKKGKIWTGWVILALMMSVELTIVACGTSPSAPVWPPSNPQDLVAKAQSLVGSKTWRNPTNNDFYSYFVLGQPKSNVQTMNCWEMYLYTRYEAGNIDANWIKSFYQASNLDNRKIWEQLGAFNAMPLSQVSPTLGSLIFFTQYGQPFPGHVALSEGGDKVISLWIGPITNTIQSTTIGEITNWMSQTMSIPVTVTVGSLP
jgi:RHS repeat-associated protein